MKRAKKAAARSLILLYGSAVLASAQTYTFQTLKYPGAVQTYAQGINAKGVVDGFYVDTSGLEHGFIYNAGTYTALNVSGSSATWLYGINANNVTVGAYHHDVSGAALTSGFAELPSGKIITFSQRAAVTTVEQAINSLGTVVGWTETGQPAQPKYAAFEKSSTVSEAITVAGETEVWATSINDGGTVVGYASTGTAYNDPVIGFAQTSSQTTTTLSYPGSLQTFPTGINNGGAIVGYYANADGSKNGFLYANGVFAAFLDPAALATFPQGINTSGLVVGYVSLSDTTTVGFVAIPVN